MNDFRRLLGLNDLEDLNFVFEDGGNGSVTFSNFKKLGKGSYGTVYKARLECTENLACNWKLGNIKNGLKYNISGEQELEKNDYLLPESENSDSRSNLNSTEVAIKLCLKPKKNNEIGLLTEYTRLCAIYNAAPDYVVKPLGLLQTPDKVHYAYLMPIYKGDIRRRGVFKNADDFVGCIDRVFIGIGKIHNEGFVHGDLKTKNIFVNDNNQCFIADPRRTFENRKTGNGKDSLGFLRARQSEVTIFLSTCRRSWAKKLEKRSKTRRLINELRYYRNMLVTKVVTDDYLKNIFEFKGGFIIKTVDYSDKDKNKKAKEAVDRILKYGKIGDYLRKKLMEDENYRKEW